MAADNLAEVLSLLTKVSSSMDARLAKLEKTIGNNKMAISKNSPEEKKPREVVKKAQPVIVTDFGRKAEQDLSKLGDGGGEGGSGKDGKDKSGLGGLGKLILPAILAAGSLAALFKGLKDAGGPLTGISKILGKGGLQVSLKMFSKALKPFASGLKSFVDDFIKLVSKPIGKIMGKVGGKAFFTTITKTFAKFLKPVLKRIPGIGSLISWGFAYSRFKNGDLIGGMIDLASGIATLFPGVGTGIGIGLDILNAFLDVKAAKAEEKGQSKGDMLKEFFGKIMDKIKNSFPIKNIMGFVGGIKKVIGGDVKGGFMEIAENLPGFQFFKSLVGMFKEQVAAATGDDGKFSFKKFFGGIKNLLFKGILKLIPKSIFGFKLRKKVAGWMGIEYTDDSADEPIIEEEASVGEDEIAAAKEAQETSEQYSSDDPSNEYYGTQVAGISEEEFTAQSTAQLELGKEQSNLLTGLIENLATTEETLHLDNMDIKSLLQQLVDKENNNGSNVISSNTTVLGQNDGLRKLQERAAY